MKKIPAQKVITRTGVVLLIAIVVITIALSFKTFSRIEETAAARRHTFMVLNSADNLLGAMIDAETGHRGYLLTNDKLFLKPYLAVRDSIGGQLKELRLRTHIATAQKHLDLLAPLIDAKMAYFSRNIELRDNNDMATVLTNVRGSFGNPLMDSIRAELKSFTQIEQTALTRHDTDFQAAMQFLFIFIIIASVLVLLLALSAIFLISREAKNRLKDLVHLETKRLLDIQEETNKQLQQANDTLLISEEKLVITLSSIGDAVMATDARGCVTLLNPIAEKLTGWTQAEATGRPVHEVFNIVSEQTRQPAIIPVIETLANGTIQGLANHTILISRSGNECPIADSCAPIRSPSGLVIGAVLVFRDVTEEYAAREYSESIINTVREPLIALDQDLRVVSVSRSFYEVFKVKPAETVGQLIYDLGNKQWDIPKLRELLETILPQKATFDNYEVEHDFAIIGKRTMLLNARQIRRVFGKERIILLAIEDITERKEIENELQNTHTELERIVQTQKVVITDIKESLDHETEGRLFDESEISHRQEALEAVYAMETALDFNIESLYDQIVQSIATTLRIPMVALYEYRGGTIVRGSDCLDNRVSREVAHTMPCAACRSVLENKNPQQHRGDLKKQFTGALCFDTTRFHSYAGVPISGTQGEVFGMINILSDDNRTFTNSEIQFIETFARYIAHELSRRELESRLRRGEEMRRLGQLTSGVAHEVRNPLNGILAIMGALSKELAGNAQFEPHMQHMRNQITRLTGLMEALLALGRPLREENIHETSMVTLVENALSTWLQTLQSAKPTVRFVKPDATVPCTIKADSTAITQMVINLLENAHNHSGLDTGIVCSIQAGNAITFAVRDGGTGIAADILPRIFDPFFTTRKGGTGLGLSIVRNVVENHKGTIRAYNNTDGAGATFEVVLPVYRGDVS